MRGSRRRRSPPEGVSSSWNASRFEPAKVDGFYESYFQRANHPTRPLAFWIRYTLFAPRGGMDRARGEVWAIFFDGENARTEALKESFPLSECEFSPVGLRVRIAGSTLQDGVVEGRVGAGSRVMEWALRYAGDEAPLLLLPERAYRQGLPKAKAVVGTPNAVYTGSLTVTGEAIPVVGWKGSQNHNWGIRHTDRYAWGQVAGFDNAPDVFLECATAQIRLGPFWSPRLTFVVLREGGEEIAWNGFAQAVRARANVDFFTWTFDASSSHGRVVGRLHAPRSAFVGLRYQNPPGGEKTCLNTKLSSAEITVERPGRASRTLVTRHRAAFEILTDGEDHGVPVVL